MGAQAQPHIRRAVRADIPSIASMIQELADFEREPNANKATHASLQATINFADDSSMLVAPGQSSPGGTLNRKVAHVLLAVIPGERPGSEEVAGMSLFFYNYSTWLASPGVYLEDLFVRPRFRRQGIATKLFGALAEETARVSEGKGRLDWSCLRWNEGALAFYESIGAVQMTDWISVRIEGTEKLQQLQDVAKHQ